MSSHRVRCQAIEVTLIDHLEPTRGTSPPRDLLPWADPYIAAVIAKVEQRYTDSEDRRRRSSPTRFDDARFGRADLAGDDSHGSSASEADADMDEKFVPWSSSAAPQGNEFPRIYGGWPLLDDTTDE